MSHQHARILFSMVLIVAACSERVTPGQSRSPDPGVTVFASPPAETAAPTPAPPSAAPRPTSVAGVRSDPLGPLAGNWIFAAKQVFDLPQPEVQIWAVPLAGGASRLALAYDVPVGGAPESPFDKAPYIRRMFAPDGRHLVISVNGQLAVVDLESGAARALGVAGYYPSWSGDGARIAFVVPTVDPNTSTPDPAIAVVPSAGGAIQRIAVLRHAFQSLEWSPDGSTLIVPQHDAILLVNANTGRISRRLEVQPGPAPSFAHWRGGAPQLALGLFGCVGSRSMIVLDGATAPIRTVVTSPGAGQFCILAHDPRWNPAANELLYLVAPIAEMCCRAHVLDLTTGHDATLPFEAYQATWTSDGTGIVYAAPNRSVGLGAEVRIWHRDGRPERRILGSAESDRVVSLASVSF